MHASVITATIPAEILERAIEAIKSTSANLNNEPGFQRGVWTYDHETNLMTAVVIFETKERADAAWERMGPSIIENARAQGAAVERHSCEVIHSL